MPILSQAAPLRLAPQDETTNILATVRVPMLNAHDAKAVRMNGFFTADIVLTGTPEDPVITHYRVDDADLRFSDATFLIKAPFTKVDVRVSDVGGTFESSAYEVEPESLSIDHSDATLTLQRGMFDIQGSGLASMVSTAIDLEATPLAFPFPEATATILSLSRLENGDLLIRGQTPVSLNTTLNVSVSNAEVRFDGRVGFEGVIPAAEAARYFTE